MGLLLLLPGAGGAAAPPPDLPGIGMGGSGTVWAGWSAEEFRDVSEWLARFDDDELAIVLALLS